MTRRLLATVLVLLAVPIAMMLGPAPALAATGSVTLTDVATTWCLDDTGNFTVKTALCTTPPGSPAQRWTLGKADWFGGFTLVNDQTGNCLDSNSSGSLYAQACNGGANQDWTVTPLDASGSSPSVLTDSATNMCLDSNSSGSAYTHACNTGNGYQLWQQPIVGANLRIAQGSTALCIGIWAGLAGSWGCTSNPDQTWHWAAPNAYGYAQLVNGSGQCLGVQNDSTSSGGFISAGTCTGDIFQYWARASVPSSATSLLLNYGSALVVSTTNGQFSNGGQLIQQPAAVNRADQMWAGPTETFSATDQAAPLCIGVNETSHAAGAWNCTLHPDQTWHWLAVPAGAVIENGYGQCLGVQNGVISAGSAITVGTCVASPDQLWVRIANGTPAYRYELESPSSNLVIGTGGITGSGAGLLLEPLTGTPDQEWAGL